MRSLRSSVCAAFLLVPALLVAEQASQSTPQHSKHTANHGRPLYIANGQYRPLTRFDKPHASGEPAPGKGVVIYNGNQKETHVFKTSDPRAPMKNLAPVVIGITAAESKNQSAHPVVVGISSSTQTTQPVVVNVASAGSNAQPVVVGVASSGFQTAAPVEPVTVGVSPRPAKRQPYRPAALDAQ